MIDSSGSDSEMRRFESSRPSQAVGLSQVRIPQSSCTEWRCTAGFKPARRRCRQTHSTTSAIAPFRRRTHDRLSADVAIRSRPVLDDEWLAKPFGQPLPHQTREDVGRTAGSEWNDHPHRPRRIGLRDSDVRQGRQHGSTGRQMQKLSTGKFHNIPLEMPVKRRFIPL
jgi:hypothetical protein